MLAKANPKYPVLTIVFAELHSSQIDLVVDCNWKNSNKNPAYSGTLESKRPSGNRIGTIKDNLEEAGGRQVLGCRP